MTDQPQRRREPVNVSRIYTPSCRGCGIALPVGVDLCATCADKPQFQPPRGSIETARQPEPPYLRSGNFRRTTEEE